MIITKTLHIGALALYVALCYIHLFVIQSKAIALVVYSPLLFVSFWVWFILLRMSVEMYQANVQNAKVI